MSRSRPGPIRRAARELRAGWWAVAGRTVDFAPQPLGRHIEPEGIGGYCCDLRHKSQSVVDGIPRDSFGELDDWVIPVAQAALGFWERKLDGEPVDRQFLLLAEWLLEHGRGAAGELVWPVEIAVPKYGLGSGWVSAMGQGQAISVLLRAHRLSGEDRYLRAARAALPPLLRPVGRGGVQSVVAGVPVLEEYPSARPSAVLNGWIFALFGLHELAVATGEKEARDLFERSAAGLVELLPRYDHGWWSLYSLYDHGRPDLAKPFYQRLHPVLLEALALIRPAAALEAYAERWRGQYTPPALARASLEKLVFRLRRGRH